MRLAVIAAAPEIYPLHRCTLATAPWAGDQICRRGCRFRLSASARYWLVLTAFALWFNLSMFAQTTEVQFLSGHDKDDAVPWSFFCTSGAQSGYWTNLPVPSHWDVKGFGTLNYHKDLTNAWQERGLYAHPFSVPPAWQNKRVFLVFEGVMTDTDAKLNGQSVGPVHQGSFYRFKYEVTSLLRFDTTNLLEVSVAKHSANESVNKAERLADYWVFGGIFRPVYLEAVPPQFIERVALDARADGRFSADVFLNGAPQADAVDAQIQTLRGDKVGAVFSTGIPAAGESAAFRLQTQIAAPKLWTAETPNLYEVQFRLKKNGAVIHQFTQRFGFRTFEVRDGDGLYLNGQRVVLKGANRHSFWPDSGRCLSEAVHRLDLNTLKDANMNAVRMSHYPPDAQFLDLCDELGIYVLDELAGWHNFYDNEVGAQRVHEMVQRDVNHPAILFWDNGNEGGFNTNLDRIFPALDPQQRRVLHPWKKFGGINTTHYQSFEEMQKSCAESMIYMPTEFLHGLYDGGAGAGLDDYWRIMSASQHIGGGFIWALLDDGVKRPDTGEMDVAGNQAPDGIVGPYREREGSFFAIKEIWSPIQIARTNGAFLVANHFSFTDVHDCKFSWQLRKFPLPGETNFTAAVLSAGDFLSPRIAPGGQALVKFPLPASPGADAFALRVDDAQGRELWTWVWTLKSSAAPRLADGPSEQHATPAETNGVILVRAGDFAIEFNRQTGFPANIRRGAQQFSFTNGPRPAVGQATLREIHYADDGPDAVVGASYDGDLKSVLWRVNNNGWVHCRYTYLARGTNDFFGVLFDYPENLVRHKQWVGNGPFHVWKNRLRGVTPGVWENDYNNTLTGFRDWIYPEFKGFFANVSWLQLQTTEGLITVVPENIPFVQVLTPEFPPTNLVGKACAAVPVCGLGLLDAIPPIGSKFKEARFGGPQGQKTAAQGEYTGTVSFYFGSLSKE